MERNTRDLSSFTSPRNKSKKLKEKKYLDRFNKLNVYSHIKDNKVHLGIKPEEVYELFNGNACGEKKGKDDKENKPTDKGKCSIDQSTLQYYMILGLQDFYQNHFLPLRDENIALKEELDKTQKMLMNYKRKNDERFELIIKHIEQLHKK